MQSSRSKSTTCPSNGRLLRFRSNSKALKQSLAWLWINLKQSLQPKQWQTKVMSRFESQETCIKYLCFDVQGGEGAGQHERRVAARDGLIHNFMSANNHKPSITRSRPWVLLRTWNLKQIRDAFIKKCFFTNDQQWQDAFHSNRPFSVERSRILYKSLKHWIFFCAGSLVDTCTASFSEMNSVMRTVGGICEDSHTAKRAVPIWTLRIGLKPCARAGHARRVKRI